MSSKRKRPADKSESIFDEDKRLRKEAIELAKNHKDVKPIKYLLK